MSSGTQGGARIYKMEKTKGRGSCFYTYMKPRMWVFMLVKSRVLVTIVARADRWVLERKLQIYIQVEGVSSHSGA